MPCRELGRSSHPPCPWARSIWATHPALILCCVLSPSCAWHASILSRQVSTVCPKGQASLSLTSVSPALLNPASLSSQVPCSHEEDCRGVSSLLPVSLQRLCSRAGHWLYPHFTDCTEMPLSWAFEPCPPTLHPLTTTLARPLKQPPCTPVASVASLSIQMGHTPCTCFGASTRWLWSRLEGNRAKGLRHHNSKQTLSLRKENWNSEVWFSKGEKHLL